MATLELNFENITEPTIQRAIRTILVDSCKSSYKVNVFTVTNSPIWVLNDRCEIVFSSEIDAFKFATYCNRWKPRVENVPNNILGTTEYRVSIDINTRIY